MVFLQIFPITADSNFESVHSMVPCIIQRHVREGFNKKSRLLVRLFEVLTKFGDDKHNKDVKKNSGKKMFFFHRRGGGGGENLDGKFHNFLCFFLLNPSLRTY